MTQATETEYDRLRRTLSVGWYAVVVLDGDEPVRTIAVRRNRIAAVEALGVAARYGGLERLDLICMTSSGLRRCSFMVDMEDPTT